MIKKITSIFNPSYFQGWGKNRRYFEGWYFKVIDPTEKFAFAVIPGIAMDDQGQKQSFIQVLDGINRTAEYHRFDSEEFQPANNRFEVQILDNSFSSNHIEIGLPELSGRIIFTGNVPWPNPWYSPGIMGPYTFVPLMECYHGIVSMDHSLTGELKVNGKTVDFTGGKGYIEKDWGRSFPSAYVWMQTNHFTKPGISFKISVAKIPWIRSSFVGFIAGIWLNDQLIQFTTYNKSELLRSYIDRDVVELQMQNRNYYLEVKAYRDHATSLASPILGFMEGRIEESMTSTVEIKLKDIRSEEIIFQDTGRKTALEVAGKIEEIIIN
jgi:hypothetical protein